MDHSIKSPSTHIVCIFQGFDALDFVKGVWLSNAFCDARSVVCFQYCASASAGGIYPMGSSNQSWLNQETYLSVAISTCIRRCPGFCVNRIHQLSLICHQRIDFVC